MKTILVIGASNSSTSINLQLAQYAASHLNHIHSLIINLNDYEMPLYSPEHEAHNGVPQLAQQFLTKIESADGIILSLAEYNGSYTPAFKNILDWTSRFKQKLWSEKPMLLLSTSPGQRGGATVLSAAQATFPHLGASIVASFSLPSFYENFSENKISNSHLLPAFKAALNAFEQALK